MSSTLLLDDQADLEVLLDDPANLEEPLEVVNLSNSHRDEDKGLEERPHHNPEHFRKKKKIKFGRKKKNNF